MKKGMKEAILAVVLSTVLVALFIIGNTLDTKASSSCYGSYGCYYQAPTPAQLAEIARNEQGVVGSAAYNTQQAKALNTVSSAAAIMTMMTPEQIEVVKAMGIGVDLGGCTTISPMLAYTMSVYNSVPYVIGFTWNGMTFTVSIPAGSNITTLINPDGSVPMWKVVQNYGIAYSLPFINK